MGLCCALRVVGVCRYVKVVANGWRVWRIGFASAVAEVDIGYLGKASHRIGDISIYRISLKIFSISLSRLFFFSLSYRRLFFF